MTDTPNVVRSGELSIGGVVLKCHVLEDGRRIIEEDSLIDFFFNDGDPFKEATDEELAAFVRFMRGLDE